MLLVTIANQYQARLPHILSVIVECSELMGCDLHRVPSVTRNEDDQTVLPVRYWLWYCANQAWVRLVDAIKLWMEALQ